MTTPQPDRSLDCRGQIYPSPILKAERVLTAMPPGEVLEVIASDENTRPDLAPWAASVGAELVLITPMIEGEYRFYLRRPTERVERAGTDDRPGSAERLFLVVLNSGFDNTPLVRSAFMYASLAAAMAFDTVVYCVQAGADTMVKSKIQSLDRSPPGQPTILERYLEATEMGVRVEVCEQTANVRAIQAEDLMDGVSLKGGAVLIDYAARAAGQLTF